jgi:hypothetical protein
MNRTWWHCPDCDQRAYRDEEAPEMSPVPHDCPAVVQGLTLRIPLIKVSGPDAVADGRQVTVARDDGPGISAVRTERGDGSNDVTVFPGVATIAAEGSAI